MKRRLLIPLALVLGLALLPPASGSPAARPLQTGFVEAVAFRGPEAALAFSRARDAGASVVRLGLQWREVAPAGARKPAGFNASNPSDPGYRWAPFDRQVKLARARGLDVIAQVVGAPEWAQGAGAPERARDDGAYRPDPAELGRFAGAAARRYGGSTPGVPRIRLWQAWNEPNASSYLAPQLSGTRLVSASWYRRLLNSFADAVHAVHRDNSVIAGGLSPFTIEGTSGNAVGPLRFMRALLCMSKGAHPRPTCPDRARFDIWSTHPYTTGGPTHHATNPDDVSLGDLPEMRALLDAAVKARKVVSRQPVRFWVTEFSWDTNPPDGYYALPIKLHARWVAEALYRMWQAGVSMVAWLQLRDAPYPAEPAQGGLYYRGSSLSSDRPKPGLAAFRFPFVAFRQGGSISVWGRTPNSRPAAVVIERGVSRRWRRLAVLRADRYGIFTGRLEATATGDYVRARLANGRGVSVGFSLTRPPDQYVLPFGGGGA